MDLEPSSDFLGAAQWPGNHSLTVVYTWTGPVFGKEYSNVLQFTSGLVLRMGAW
jgi:hypothetical protein